MSDDYGDILKQLRASATPEQAPLLTRLESANTRLLNDTADRAMRVEWERHDRVDHAFEQIANTNELVSQIITAFADQRDGLPEFVSAQTLATARIEVTLGQVASRLGKLEHDLQELNIRHGGQIDSIVEQMSTRDTLADERWEQEFQQASTADRNDLRDRLGRVETLLAARPEQRVVEHESVIAATVEEVLKRLAGRSDE